MLNPDSDQLMDGSLPWQQQLSESFASRRKQGTLAHAYLLCGDSGTGKLIFARQLAGFLLCHQSTSGGTACGQCRSCVLLAAGNHPDLLEIMPEEGSAAIKIDQIRKLTDFSQRTAHAGKGRVVVINPAEAMAAAPANALLKVLEEPPAETWFLVISHQPGRVLLTIKSRCQTQLMPVPDRTVLDAWLLQQHPTASSEELAQAIALTGGRPLLALAALQEALPARQRALHAELVQMLQGKRLPTDLAKAHEKADRGQLLTLLMQTVHRLVALQLDRSTKSELDKEFNSLADILLVEHEDSQRARLLLNLYRRLQQLLVQQQSSSNPNPLLALEELFLAWQAVGISASRARARAGR